MKTVDININNGSNWQNLLDLVYPVGYIYITVNDVDPAILFGGTWQRICGEFLLGAGDIYTAGDTGGEATHALTPAETATKAHTHTMDHGHGNDFSFSVDDHAQVSNRALLKTDGTSGAIVVSDHAASTTNNCTIGTSLAITVDNHTYTQAKYKYTAPKSHTHGLSAAGALINYWSDVASSVSKPATISNSSYYYSINRYFHTPGKGISDSNSRTGGTALGGATNAATGGTANATSGSRSTDFALGSNHVGTTNVISTYSVFKTYPYTHTVTQPTFTTPTLTHTPSVSGSITAYGTSSAHQYTGGQTEASGDAHNNMPPLLAVYMWKRTA